MIYWQDLKFIAGMQKQNWHKILKRKSVFVENDEKIKSVFADTLLSYDEKFVHLVRYFWQAHKHYYVRGQASAYYHGYSSIYGSKNDGVEGVSRLLPLWASFLANENNDNTHSLEMSSHIKAVLLDGTNPSGLGYWGDIDNRSTLICEAADIALALWISKKAIWFSLSPTEQTQILDWLVQVLGKETADNNWHLFVLLTEVIVADLAPDKLTVEVARYQRIKEFYVGDGCFKDGEKGEVDLYNAWAFQYSLYWINAINPKFDPEFITKVVAEYSDWFQYMFTNNGCPLFGRSLCYRMAMPVPVLAASSLGTVSSGIAKQALLKCWEFFVAQGALSKGSPTQGVFEEDLIWLDPYSGPASAFWSTRSLVMYFFLSQKTSWQEEPLQILPAELEPVILDKLFAGIVVKAGKGSCEVQFKANQGKFHVGKLKLLSVKEKLKDFIFAVSHRQANNLLKERVKVFDSSLNYYRKSE
jgi:hypothetical protein